MINRDNYLDIKKYINFLEEVNQCEPRTVATYWPRFRHLLEWADGTRFSSAHKIRPTFPVYLGGLKNDDGQPAIGVSHFGSCCVTARAFFKWAKLEYPRTYKDIDQNWIKSIKPPKARAEQSEVKTREYYRVEEVIKLATCEANTIMLKRMQAAVAFLFLSGMRIGAFVSLPIKCVDIEAMKVKQLPAMGVNTKFHKAAITTLINIPELLEVARNWDAYLRERVSDDMLWYVPLTHDLQPATTNPTKERIVTRHDNFRDDLRQLCKIAGVKYKSPHKFRDGHTVWTYRLIKNMAGLKAVSQNLMHKDIGVTDGIYGNMDEDETHKTIAGLANVKMEDPTDQDLLNKVIALLQSKVAPTPG
jgi:integrase